MSYIDRLKSLNSEKCSPLELPKVPKAPFDSFGTTEDGRFQEKTETATAAPLSADVLAAVTHWLDAIGETDPAERARVLDKCRTDSRALAYVLDLVAELSKPPPSKPPRPPVGLVLPFVRLKA